MRRDIDPSAPLALAAPLWVKICGIVRYEDAARAVDASASAIGLNFFRGSPRYVEPEKAKEIVSRLGDSVEWVGVFVDETEETIEKIAAEVGLDRIQLHGHETPDFVARFRERGMKAARIGDENDVVLARNFPGELLLVDAKVRGALGGTGESFDWALLDAIVAERSIVLAGGLRPDNVEAAVRTVRPFGVDTASGVESSPGVKDSKKIADFIRNARRGATP